MKISLNVALFGTLIITCCIACQRRKDNIAFPVNQTEFLQPVSRPLKFGDAKKIKWEHSNPDSIRPAAEYKIDFNKLPTKTFETGKFRPMAKPMTEVKFDLNSLPDTAFDLALLPAKKFTFRVSRLRQPIRVKAQRPQIREKYKGSQSIFEYGVDQGFSSGGGMGAFLKDRRGFLWISTSNGLYRFDGENFDVFTKAQGLTDFSYESLTEDGSGRIWASTGNGIDVLNPGAGTVQHLDKTLGLVDDDTKFTIEDNLGRIWIATNSGINILDLEKGTIQVLTTAQGLCSNVVLSLQLDDLHNIWIGTEAGVNIINPEKKYLKRLTKSEGLGGNSFQQFYQDLQGCIWIGTDAGIDIIDQKKGTLNRLSKEQGLTSDETWGGITSDSLGRIWIAMSSAIDIISADRKEIKHLNSSDGLSEFTSRILRRPGSFVVE